MAQIVNILTTDECQLNLDLQGDYDVMLNSVSGTMNIPILVKNEDYVEWETLNQMSPIEVTCDRVNLITGETTTKKYEILNAHERCTVGMYVYVTSTFSSIGELLRQLYNPTLPDLAKEEDMERWEKFSCLLKEDPLTGHLRFKCNIVDASPRMKYILGIRQVLPTVSCDWDYVHMDDYFYNLPVSERPPFLLGSPYYFIYVENAKCNSRFVWKHHNLAWKVYDPYHPDDPEANTLVVLEDYGFPAEPTPTDEEKFDEKYSYIPPSSTVNYQKRLQNSHYVATQNNLLSVIYNSFNPGTMFQFSGGQFTCSGETLSNVKLKIIGLLGESMNNYSEVLWSFQLAPNQNKPEPPIGVTKEGLEQLQAQQAEQEQQEQAQAEQDAQAQQDPQQQPDQDTQPDQPDMQTMSQMLSDLKEENQRLLQLMIDQRTKIENMMARDEKEDVEVAQKLMPKLPTYVGPGPSVNPFKKIEPIKPIPVQSKPAAPAQAPAQTTPTQPETTQTENSQETSQPVAQAQPQQPTSTENTAEVPQVQPQEPQQTTPQPQVQAENA